MSIYALPPSAPATRRNSAPIHTFSVKKIGWTSGSGPTVGKVGPFVDLMVNPLTKISVRTKVDNKAHTITLVLKEKQGPANGMVDQPKRIQLGLSGVQVAKPYQLIVQDEQGHVLKHANIVTTLGM